MNFLEELLRARVTRRNSAESNKFGLFGTVECLDEKGKITHTRPASLLELKMWSALVEQIKHANRVVELELDLEMANSQLVALRGNLITMRDQLAAQQESE